MNMEAQGYIAYLPLVSIDGVYGPLLPGYCFVATWPREGLWRPITNTRGVSGILMTGEAPSIVPERDIEALKLREEGGVIRIRSKPVPDEPLEFEHGDKLKLTDGAFGGFEAIFDYAESADRIFVFVEFMRRLTRVEVTRSMVA